ncbi:Transcription antiterminator [Pedobacter sp. BAL39]|uniref:UpxY family transcription antiterminator n=1 Tax=Pedobacter sp. BAL39 TaxID=391596 RepID=UPI0001559A96|nr:UpxY family transcription antiterminator [Pedobacter sp. BAL39]EDM38325.1 Transcription antiterminator [Pedobacter sp. BAL39]
METPIAAARGVQKWFAVYTRPRWEKKVEQQLKMQGITCYCPLRKVQSQWADRIKVVELPLFSSYVFVCIHPREELNVRLNIGVVNFVYYMGHLAEIRHSVIEEIKSNLEKYPDAEIVSMRDLEVGDRVRIKAGLMGEQEGKVLQVRGKNVLLVIDNLSSILISKVMVSALELN